ncbi:MAG: hypothetical protein QM536_09605, partial [Chitinophagaceae bacterium]|nr:hypothetical protein [Chitinophagaceae bacterium]
PMVNCIIKILLFYIFFSHIAVCQTLSADEKKIGYDLSKAVRSIGTGGADIIAESFGTLWQNGGFNNTHKALIRDIALKMKEKKYSINPHFMYLCSYTSFAIKRAGIQADSLTRLLEMNKFVIDHYSPKEYSDFLFLMNIFFVRNALVLKPHYQMYVRNGKYRFENQNTETVDPAFSIPTQETQNVTKTDSVVEEEIAEEDTWNNQTGVAEIENTEVASFLGFPTNTETKRGQQRIVFENADIIMVSYSDSVKIVNTSGSFFIPEKIWEGRGGEFQWSSRNNFFQTAQVSLAEYEFSVAKPEVFCKNVVLTFDALLDTKVIGDFAYKGILGTKKEKQTYPRFISYNNDIGVNMQDSFLTYRGCFAFEGAHLYGKCVDNSKISQLEITNTVGYKAVLQSTYFTLDKPIITSGDARFSLTHGEHSLDNHFVTLKYQTETKELLASSPHGSKKNSRFYSSFYKVYIKGDVLKWNMQADSLTISIDHAKDAVPVIVESDEYFSEDRYRKYMGLLPFHPLSLVKDYLHKKGQTNCSLEELTLFYTNIADSYAKRYALLLGAMKTLFYENLITFIAADEFENALFDAFGNKNYNISLTDLGKHYVESSQKKKDYDKIFIPSITAKQPNVVMNFQKEYMTINGVNSSFFTNDLKIYMLPDNETIKMHKGKNISLDGKVFTPTMAYIGKEFDFQYDSFLMRMNKIDSIRLYDPQDSLKRGSEDASLKNHIVNTTGVLRIALPHNKAGDPVKKISPKYISKDSSYIYFDSKEILGGAYNRKIYFVVPKMDVDNLNDKANNTIRLKGTFYSDNIIPTIQETLQMMPDRSLGFQHIIEPPGYLVYKGKGDFFGTIQLDNNGIVGTGKLAYSVALLESSKFIFYQDSASAQGFNGILQEKITIDGSFPKVEIEKYTMKWIPKKDIMLLHSKGNPFRFYNNTIVFDGVLILSQKALFGSGKLSTRGSITESKKYMFLQDEFSARNATFRVVSDNNYTDRVRGDNVKLQFSFSIGRVVIHPEEKNIPALSFPEAKIVTSIQTAVWDLKKEKIFMKNDIDQLHISSYFISTDPKTDSLKFIANKGEYDMQTFQINLDGVENVQIVDATVIPDKGKIIIRKGSEIPPLSNAVVHFITDPDTLHTFVKSNIKISSRKKSIQGTAQYTYTHTNKEISYYNFHEFVMDSTKIKSSSKYARRTIA